VWEPGTPQHADAESARGLSLQERLESSRAGRVIISVFLVVIVGGIVVANLPKGPVQRRLASVTQPYMNATALDQYWGMFTYPRRDILYLEARVVHADGQVTMWHPPTDGRLLGGYRDVRWRKFVEHAVDRPGNADSWPQLWEPLARYIASEAAHRGARPVSVTLVKRTAFVLPPDGSRPGRTPFEEHDYYTLRLP
jgi:hypothetical protein